MDASTARISSPLPDSLMQPFLLYVLARRRVHSGMTYEELGQRIGYDRSIPWRWLNNEELGYARLKTGEGKEAVRGMDAVVSLLAEAFGVEPLELWAEALEEWRNDPDGVYLPSLRDDLRVTQPPES